MLCIKPPHKVTGLNRPAGNKQMSIGSCMYIWKIDLSPGHPLAIESNRAAVDSRQREAGPVVVQEEGPEPCHAGRVSAATYQASRIYDELHSY